MNTNVHGNAIFYWSNHARHDFLTQEMKDDTKGICADYTFYDFISDYNGGYASRDEFLCWFHSAWRFIPKDMLYETYKEELSGTDFARGRWAYNYFFKPDLRKEIMALNKHDTVESLELRSLLDKDGCLTVYHGMNCVNSMRHSYSWTLDKDKAIDLGFIDAAIVHKLDSFYCVTGKVKLKNIITYISGHSTHEIAVMPERVKDQTKEVFSTEDYTPIFEQRWQRQAQ
jgi:hypothetical protein